MITIRVRATNGDPKPVERVALPEVEGLTFGDVSFLGREMHVGPDARGRMSQATTLTYTVPVTTAGAGTYEIPPLTVTVAGKESTAPLESLRLKVVEDLVGSRVLILELQDLPKRIYEGEPYTVDLTLGWLQSINREDCILQAPWYGHQNGVIPLEQGNNGNMVDFPIGPGRRRTVAVDRLGIVDRNGDAYQMFALRRRFVATRAGMLPFPRTVLEVSERRQQGRFRRGSIENYYQVIPEFFIEVVPVPEAGRPVEWTGAVGAISVDREALRRDIDAGDSIEFELRYSGEGNIEFFDAPDLDRLPSFEGFRVLGVEDDKQPYLRVITYDLVPTSSDCKEIPSVPLSVFDTATESFVTLTSEPIEIRVRAPKSGTDDPFVGLAADEDGSVIAMRDIAARRVEGEPRGGSSSLWSRGPGAGAAALSLILTLLGWCTLRRVVAKNGDPAGIVARRRRGAMRTLERELNSRGANEDPRVRSLALERFLAARTNTPESAWLGRSVFEAGDGADQRFEPSGALQAKFEDVRAALDRPVFGGATEQGGDRTMLIAFAKQTIEEGL